MRIWLVGLFFSLSVEGGLLPGGMVNPALNTAAVINPAVLCQDWETNFTLFYSPAINADIPQRYLSSATYTNSSGYGLSAGITASTKDQTALYTGFAGIGLNLSSQIAIGASLDFPTLGESFRPRWNIGANWLHGQRKRFGIVGYDIAGNPRLGFGFGWVFPRRFSAEANLLSPGMNRRDNIDSEVSVLLAASYYWWQGIGVSWGGRYDLEFSGERVFSFHTGLVATINERVVLTAQYSSHPEAIIFGVMMGYFPDGGDRQNLNQSRRLKKFSKSQ